VLRPAGLQLGLALPPPGQEGIGLSTPDPCNLAEAGPAYVDGRSYANVVKLTSQLWPDTGDDGGLHITGSQPAGHEPGPQVAQGIG
jgi:hypothetical protein